METNEEHDPTVNLPDADRGPDEGENASGPIGEISREEDTSGGPVSSGAGEGAAEGTDEQGGGVPGGASEGA